MSQAKWIGKQNRAWESADADDGSSFVLSAREAAIMPSTSENKRGWTSADAGDGSSIVLSAREVALMLATSGNKRGWGSGNRKGQGIIEPFMQLPRAPTGKRKRSRPGSHGNQIRGGSLATRQRRNWNNQQHEDREPNMTRAAYSHRASLPSASLMAVMPKNTKSGKPARSWQLQVLEKVLYTIHLFQR
ncbi:hypothetical protein N9L68_07200 [bacterium]|nr:hypothetical protein [bacterium]